MSDETISMEEKKLKRLWRFEAQLLELQLFFGTAQMQSMTLFLGL